MGEKTITATTPELREAVLDSTHCPFLVLNEETLASLVLVCAGIIPGTVNSTRISLEAYELFRQGHYDKAITDFLQKHVKLEVNNTVNTPSSLQEIKEARKIPGSKIIIYDRSIDLPVSK